MTDTPKIAVILLSGGLDSMVSAAIAREQGFTLHAITIDYGQRHVRQGVVGVLLEQLVQLCDCFVVLAIVLQFFSFFVQCDDIGHG